MQALLLATALTTVARPASAQVGLTFWAGAGAAKSAGSAAFGKEAKQLGVQLGLPLLQFAVRADALMLGPGFDTDAVGYNLNAVLQLRVPIVQPYVLAGRGSYALESNTHADGWNAGGGVRVGFGRVGGFAEVRRHYPIKRTITVVGLTF